jgi:hypothetical protein
MASKAWASSAPALRGVGIDLEKFDGQGVAGFGTIYIEGSSERIIAVDFEASRSGFATVAIDSGGVNDVAGLQVEDSRQCAELGFELRHFELVVNDVLSESGVQAKNGESDEAAHSENGNAPLEG